MRYIRNRRFAIADPPCVRVSHPRSGSKYTCRCGCGVEIYIPPRHSSARRDRSEGARPPPGGPGQAGAEGPGRPGLVNWRIEQVPRVEPIRSYRFSHPADGPRSPPRAARPRHQLGDAPTPLAARGPRPSLPAGPGRRAPPSPPRPEGRCDAPRGRAGGGDGVTSALAVVGPPAWPAPVTPGLRRPSTHRPPRPARHRSRPPLPRTAGPVGPPHYIPSDPCWVGRRCAALRWPRKFSGGAGCAIQSGPPCSSRSGSYADLGPDSRDVGGPVGWSRPSRVLRRRPGARPRGRRPHARVPSSELVGATGHAGHPSPRASPRLCPQPRALACAIERPGRPRLAAINWRTPVDVGGRELASARADGVSGGGSEAAVSAASTGEPARRWNAGPKGPAVPRPPPSARRCRGP